MAQKNGLVNSLTQFIGQYNSDSESDSDNEDIQNKSFEVESTEWTKCFTKDTGLPYYYNSETKEVTWEAPNEYTNYLNYIIAQTNDDNINHARNWNACVNEKNETYYVNKITRIIAWEAPPNFIPKNEPTQKTKISSPYNERISKRRKKNENSSMLKDDSDENITKDILKESSKGSVNLNVTNKTTPPFSQKIYSIKNDSELIKPTDVISSSKLNSESNYNIILFDEESQTSLIDDENTSNDTKSIKEEICTNPMVLPSLNNLEEEIDVKTIKRKRRIEFATIPKNDSDRNKISNNNEITGNTIPADDKKNVYANFVKGGMLEKLENSPESTNITQTEISEENLGKINEEIKEQGGLMADKLKFLCSELQPATSAQIMFIQYETLIAAYESKNLNENYLLTWIRDTSSTLEKLEKEAIPDGWICEWDR